MAERVEITAAFGADAGSAEDVAPVAVGDDPDYRDGGKDEIIYRVELDEFSGEPASVRATLYYQGTPPYYLQDKFCTSRGEDTMRLYFLPGSSKLPRARSRIGSSRSARARRRRSRDADQFARDGSRPEHSSLLKDRFAAWCSP